jgi:hypothetical protein
MPVRVEENSQMKAVIQVIRKNSPVRRQPNKRMEQNKNAAMNTKT